MMLIVRDINQTLKLFPAIWFLAWSDTKARYRRSVLGPLWLVLGTAIGVAGLGFLWSTLLKADRTIFIPSLTVGLVVWQLISGSITESSSTLVKNANVIKNIKMPFLFFSVQVVMKQVINFIHNLIVIAFILALYPPESRAWTMILLLPNFFILTGNLLWIVTLLSLLGARLRDMEPLVTAFMPLFFFLSPVIYRPEHLGIHAKLAWFNPFTYLISLIRDPLQGHLPSLFVYGGALGMLIIGWSLTLFLLQRKYSRISFWV